MMIIKAAIKIGIIKIQKKPKQSFVKTSLEIFGKTWQFENCREHVSGIMSYESLSFFNILEEREKVAI